TKRRLGRVEAQPFGKKRQDNKGLRQKPSCRRGAKIVLWLSRTGGRARRGRAVVGHGRIAYGFRGHWFGTNGLPYGPAADRSRSSPPRARCAPRGRRASDRLGCPAVRLAPRHGA